MSHITRNARMNLRLKRAERVLLESAAELCEQSPSEFTRRAAVFQAQRLMGVEEPESLVGLQPPPAEESRE